MGSLEINHWKGNEKLKNSMKKSTKKGEKEFKNNRKANEKLKNWKKKEIKRAMKIWKT